MILIIGGAYQGKEEFAKEAFPEFTHITKYHDLVQEQLQNNIDPCTYLAKHMDSYNDCVIICDDMSSGIVPMDPDMRRLREELGRALSLLSKHAEHVYRVFCGLPLQLK